MGPSLTIGVDFDTGRLTGEIDGKQAVGQAITLALATARWRYSTFSADYGSEGESLLGRHRDLVRGELERMIREALSRDERILEIEDFTLEFTGDEAHIHFTVRTVFGDLERGEQFDLQ